MANLIHGKQLRNSSIVVSKLVSSGATNGYVATYESGNDQILWQPFSAVTVTSLTAQNGVSADTSTGVITIQARTDNQSIFIDGSQNISLGNTSGVIGGAPGGQYTFSDNIIMLGNLTVQGTTTTVNSEEVNIADNFMTLNSNFTAGTPTQNAGIQVSRGAEANAFLFWDETNNWWAITNPTGSGGTGTTYAILTTASIESTSNELVVTQGGGADADKLFLSLTSIPNSALTNNSITVTAGEGLGGGGTVALGGTVVLSANTDGTTITSTADQLNVLKVPNALTAGPGLTGGTFDGSAAVTFGLDSAYETYVTGGTFNTGTTAIDYVGTGNQWSNFSVDLTALSASLSADTYVQSGAVAYTNEAGTLTLTKNDTSTVVITGFTDVQVTGGTHAAGTITFTKNDGSTFQVTGLDSTDSFSTGGTISYTNEAGTITINGNDGFTQYTITGITDVQTTGGTYAAGTITFTQNDGTTYQVTGLDSTDTFVTGGTWNGGTESIDFVGNAGFIPFSVDLSTLDVNDTFSTGATLSNGVLTINGNAGFTSYTAGTFVETVSGNSPITASTTNGAVSVGLDYTSLQLAVQTTSDKELVVTATTSGNNFNTGIAIAATPTNNAYVKVEVNGVGYILGDGVTTKDSYFSSDGTAGGVRTIAAITAGDIFMWNGTNVGFQLDTNDRVDFYYEVLQ